MRTDRYYELVEGFATMALGCGWRDLEKAVEYYAVVKELDLEDEVVSFVEDLYSGMEDLPNVNLWILAMQHAITAEALNLAVEKYPELEGKIDYANSEFFDAIYTNYLDSFIHPALEEVIYDWLENPSIDLKHALVEAVKKAVEEITADAEA